MFLPLLESPVSFFFHLSSFPCKFLPHPLIPAIAQGFSIDLSLFLWFSQCCSNCILCYILGTSCMEILMLECVCKTEW